MCCRSQENNRASITWGTAVPQNNGILRRFFVRTLHTSTCYRDTAAAGHDFPEARSKFLAEKAINDRVHAAVRTAEPLRHRDHSLAHELLRVRIELLLHVAPEADAVQRHPREGKQRAHHH